MAARESVNLSLKADISDLKRSLGEIPGVTKQEAAKMTRELQVQYNKATRAAQKAAKKTKVAWADTAKSAAMVGASVAGAAVAVVAFGQSMADLNNELTDTATRTGLLVEQVAGLRLAGEGAGVPFAKLESGLNKLPKAMSDAARGSKTAADAFARLGVEIENDDGLRDASEVFAEATFALGAMDDAALKSATAMDLFGTKAGGALVQSGALENLDAFVSLAMEFGVDVGPKATKSAADFQREMALLSTVSQGVMQDLMNQIGGSGGLNDALRLSTKGVIIFGSVVGSTFEGVVDAFGMVLGPIAEFGYSLSQGDFAGALESAKRNGLEFGEGLLRTTNMVGLAATIAEGSIKGLNDGLEKTARLDVLADATSAANARAAGGTPAPTAGSGGAAGETTAKIDERAQAFARLQQQQKSAAESRLSDLDRIEAKYREQIEVIRDGQAAGAEIADADAALATAQMERMEAMRVLAQKASEERVEQMRMEAEESRRIIQATVNASGDAASAIGDVFGIASAAFAEGSTEASQRAAKALFIASQSAAAATIGLRVAEGLMVAATLPPPASGIKAAAVIAQGVASSAMIATAQPPTFDRGGIIMGGTGDQVSARVLPGEAMLNRTATQNLGSRMIDQLNTNDGRSPFGGGQVVNVWKGRVYDDFITDTREARFSPVYGGT